jgi:hypothetical protein
MRLRDRLKKDQKLEAYKKQRNHTTNLIKKKKKQFIDKILEKSSNQDTRHLWNVIRNRSSNPHPVIKTDNGLKVTDPSTIANTLNEYFATVASKSTLSSTCHHKPNAPS